MTSDLIDGKQRPVEVNRTHSEQTVAKYLDASDAEKRLNWKPTHTLATGLKATVDWYRQFIGQLTPREI